MSYPQGRIQTVLGVIEPGELGFTQPHEHLLVNLIPKPWREGAVEIPITLENVGVYRYNWVSNPFNLYLDSETDAIDEMNRYREAGGRAVVEQTIHGLDRNPEGLARISEAAGVHVIMGCGYYQAAYHPPELTDRTVEGLGEELLAEFSHGVGESGIKPGLIGEIGLSWPVEPGEEKVLRAAAMVQKETGAVLSIHPGRHEDAPADALRIVREAGGDPGRTVICHVERTLFNLDEMARLADTGCYLEFDLFGQESGFYPMADIDMPNDARRIDYVKGLMERGFSDKLLISQDICFKTRLSRYGGEGYVHILNNVRPMMLRKGLTEADITTLTVENPSKMLMFI